jgi:uncharacterized protein YyaL (SSP411 family)
MHGQLSAGFAVAHKFMNPAGTRYRSMTQKRLALFLAVVFLSRFHVFSAELEGHIDWEPWSESVFARAETENRFVLLDLGTGWCHWCHVMEEVSYSDPAVIDLIKRRYIAVRVDADARPDLANRYEDYGWPATIVFNGNGSEIVKRRGYIAPQPMASMLQAIIDDPTPGPSVTQEEIIEPSSFAVLSADSRDEMRALLIAAYDKEIKGWGDTQKFLDWDVLEYCLEQAVAGDRHFEQMARDTLRAETQLIDPVWGGVCQYSTDGDWKHPHFEKIMQTQAEVLRIYALSYSLWHDPAYLESADKIRSYLRRFLTSPDGAFYSSQDADLVPGEHGGEYFELDDAHRMARGLPQVDTHIYARENGWAINALTNLYESTGDSTCLVDAIRSAEWILKNRSAADGGFSHGSADGSGLYLADTLSMGRAFLALYEATGDRKWLEHATAAGQFINRNFRSTIGFLTSTASGTLKPKAEADENAALIRFANRLSQYTGSETYHEVAEHGMKYLAAAGVAKSRGIMVGGILLADRELEKSPKHLVVVGSKNDHSAQALFMTVLKERSPNERIEWWDPSEGPLPNPDTIYPQLDRASVFFCSEQSCSAPIFSSEELVRKFRERK